MTMPSAPTVIKDVYEPSAFFGAVMAVSGVKGSMIALHGAPGCYTIATHVRTDLAPMGGYSGMRPSGIVEDNIIMGTSVDKLRHNLEFIKRTAKPSLVAIINSDATALTADDIVGHARTFEAETGIPAFAFDMPGMRGSDVVGYDAVLRALVARFAKPNVEKKENYVNLIGPYFLSSQNWIFDTEGIIELLERIGLKVNCVLTRNTSIKDIENFAAAKMNIMLTNEDMPLFSRESERLGVKSFGDDLPLPYGISNTETWLMAIAREFEREKEATKVLKEDRDLVKRVLGFNYSYTWVSMLMMQKRAAILGRAQFAASLARFLLYDLNMYPVLIALLAGTRKAMEKSKGLLKPIQEDGCPAQVMENPLYVDFARAIKANDIDVIIGSRIEKSLIEGMRYPHLSIGGAFYFQSFRFIPYPYVGYKGVLYLIQELSLLMEDMFEERDKWRAQAYEYI